MLSVCIWDFILWSVTRHQSLRNLAFDLIFVIEIYILCVWLCHVRIARSIEHTHTVPDIPEYLRRQPPRPQSRPARKHTHGGSQLPRVAMGSAPMEDDLIVELSSMSSALWVPEGSLPQAGLSRPLRQASCCRQYYRGIHGGNSCPCAVTGAVADLCGIAVNVERRQLACRTC